jgi:hypothetical protein
MVNYKYANQSGIRQNIGIHHHVSAKSYFLKDFKRPSV